MRRPPVAPFLSIGLFVTTGPCETASQMKSRRLQPKPARREIFVLTPAEKKTVCFVLFALLLGLATKHYRDTHPPALAKAEISADGKRSPSPGFRRNRPPKQSQSSAVPDR